VEQGDGIERLTESSAIRFFSIVFLCFLSNQYIQFSPSTLWNRQDPAGSFLTPVENAHGSPLAFTHH